MPILSVMLGFFFFNEVLNKKRIFSIFLVISSILYLIIMSYQSLPWMGLIVAISWALYNLVRKSVVKKTNKEWIDVLQKAEIPFGVVNRLEDLKDDPQLKSLDFFREYNHPTEGKLEIPDSAFRYNRHSLPIRRHQPKLGEQSKDCLLYTSPSPRDRTRSRMPSSA